MFRTLITQFNYHFFLKIALSVLLFWAHKLFQSCFYPRLWRHSNYMNSTAVGSTVGLFSYWPANLVISVVSTAPGTYDLSSSLGHPELLQPCTVCICSMFWWIPLIWNSKKQVYNFSSSLLPNLNKDNLRLLPYLIESLDFYHIDLHQISNKTCQTKLFTSLPRIFLKDRHEMSELTASNWKPDNSSRDNSSHALSFGDKLLPRQSEG